MMFEKDKFVRKYVPEIYYEEYDGKPEVSIFGFTDPFLADAYEHCFGTALEALRTGLDEMRDAFGFRVGLTINWIRYARKAGYSRWDIVKALFLKG